MRSYLVDATIGERCVVWASVIEDSVVEDDVRIGPFAHVRGGSHIEADVELGNFAEVKASRVGRGSKQHHFSYIGDATLGERVNIGAGTITANYDGTRKHRTIIGDRRVHRLRHDPASAGDRRRGCLHRRRLGGHQGRAAPARSRSACLPGSASASSRPHRGVAPCPARSSSSSSSSS